MNAYLLSLNPEASVADQWDYGFLKDFLEGKIWQPPSWEGFDIQVVSQLPRDDKAIVVVPARHHVDLVDGLNYQLDKINHTVLFLIGDEEASFEVEKIKHPSTHIWVQNPHPGRHDDFNKLGTGYPPQLRQIVPALSPAKSTEIFFSGQLTHSRRTEMWEALFKYEGLKDVHGTDGFTKGYSHEDYYKRMLRAKMSPAPSGAIIPDSFRFYEALECMSLVVADERDSHGKIDGYWEWLFGKEPPLYLIKDWESLIGYIKDGLENWPYNIHKQTAWWINEKRKFAYKVMEQLND